MALNGFPESTITNSSGFYSAIVESGWSGTVTPQKADYTFTPAERSYNNVLARQPEQDYTGTLRQYTLTVQKDGTGSGIVMGESIECGSVCTTMYDAHTVVTLTAEADSGSVFEGWSVSECGILSECTITMDADMTITATFNLTGGPGPGPIPTPIPEPTTLCLYGLGLIGILTLVRRKTMKRR